MRKSAGQIFLYAEEIDLWVERRGGRFQSETIEFHPDERVHLAPPRSGADRRQSGPVPAGKVSRPNRRRQVRISDPDRRAAVRGGNPPDPRLITFVMTVAEGTGCGTSRRHADLIRVGEGLTPARRGARVGPASDCRPRYLRGPEWRRGARPHLRKALAGRRGQLGGVR